MAVYFLFIINCLAFLCVSSAARLQPDFLIFCADLWGSSQRLFDFMREMLIDGFILKNYLFMGFFIKLFLYFAVLEPESN